MVAMRVLVVSVVLLLLFVIQQGKSDFISEEEKLRKALLTNYTTKVRPEYKTYVYVAAMLSSLNHLNIASQSMSVNVLIIAAWTDKRLKWNSTDYSGLESLVTAPEDIWTPPLVIENSVDNVGVVGGKERDGVPVRITSAGIVQWSPPTEVTVSCEMLIAQYPFDTQSCPITLIGWTYPLSEMDMTVGPIEAYPFASNGEFDLINTSSDTIKIGGPNESEAYRKVVFKLTFRRKWQFYGQNLLMPIVLNSLLMNAVFLLPIESGEKMGYSLTVLLSYTVFLTWVTENLPPVSTDTSILQVYLAVVLCLGCLATLLTTLVLHFYHHPADKPLSKFCVTLATRILIPLRDCSCFRKRSHKHGGGNTTHDILSRKNPVFPADSRPRNSKLTQRKVGDFGTMNITDVDGLPIKDAEGFDRQGTKLQGSGRDSAWEATEPALTWQEFAALLDKFLFCFFAALLLVLTTVIFSLLYAKY